VAATRLEVTALPGMPAVAPGDDLASLILAAVERANLSLRPGDVLVVAQKIVSKAENRFADLAAVTPSAEAERLARETVKDARLVELILGESQRVLRARPGVLIVVHRLGFVLANAGIDASNVAPGAPDRVLLLPADPDASAAGLRAEIGKRTGVAPVVIVNDSLGRAWRSGTIGTALGAAGLPALLDLRGKPDLFGRTLRATEIGLADQLASAASLVQGEADEGTPVAHVRGAATLIDAAAATNGAALIRRPEEDLFL
jgi:coenzyme F420-0:L-glutamate ligase/coenzyme F420-1:gamma-L-glutamate ligase